MTSEDGINPLAKQNDQNQPGGLGEIRPDSKGVREEQDRVNPSNSTRRVSSPSSLIGGTDIGKILSQLEELRDEYDDYTGEHKERLETRLSESEARRKKFFAKADALREEILSAIERQQESDRTLTDDASDEEG